MKTISTELATHLAGDVTTLATCWKLTRTDSTVMGFTSHDTNLTIDSQLYEAESGFTPSAIGNDAGLAVDNLDVEGMLNSSTITEADIMAGRYDFDEIEIFQVNYNDVSQGKLQLRRGWLGEVSLSQQHFVAEVRGLTQKLSKTLGELFSPSCRANLGDVRCGVSLASYTATGTITSVTSNRVFSDSALTEDDGYFNFGVITFTGGNNNGLRMEVKTFVDNEISLVMPMPYSVQVGDGYSMVAGCDKRFATCRDIFNNVLNFRGEPYVPGVDHILQTSATANELDR